MTADAVLLVAFGGPTRPEEIRPFLANVARGRAIPPARLEEVAGHYERIGGFSPLNALTMRQAAALERALAARGTPLPVYVGMRNWAPYVADTLARMADDGRRRAVGVILAPHASEASRERYVADVAAGRAALGARAPDVVWVAPWFDDPLFVATVADAVTASLATLPAARRDDAALVCTAHSIPLAAARRSPYAAEVETTARLVAERLGRRRWQVAWQSRSGDPAVPWLAPDLDDALAALAADGVRDVVVAPIGFVCDHVEVLYDLDVEAAATAARLGLGFARASTANDHPLFVRLLAERVVAAA